MTRITSPSTILPLRMIDCSRLALNFCSPWPRTIPSGTHVLLLRPKIWDKYSQYCCAVYTSNGVHGKATFCVLVITCKRCHRKLYCVLTIVEIFCHREYKFLCLCLYMMWVCWELRCGFLVQYLWSGYMGIW